MRRALLLAALALAACSDPVLIIGRPGLGDGEFRQPRALAASEHGLAVVDKSGRLQLFELDGTFRTSFLVGDPEARRGYPCGVTWLPDGTLALADTHQSQVAIYDTSGKLLSAMGSYGVEPGYFLNPQRILVLPGGALAVTEYGISLNNRVQVFSAGGEFLRTFGGKADAEGGLLRPMGIVRLDDGNFVVADQGAGLLRFGKGGRFLGTLGGTGARWPDLTYGLCRTQEGDLVATHLSTHRLTRLAPTGEVLGVYGGPGRDPGTFAEPWDVSEYGGFLYVADRMNHRVQRLDLGAMDWSAP